MRRWYRSLMDLRKLRHAVTLAEEGTFARAARRLNLSQPALTRSVQALETSLGLRLFDRTGTGARPTTDGLRVLDHARTLLRQEASLRSEATLLARGESGKVAFGLGPMLTPALGPVLAAILGGGARLDIRVEIEPVHVMEEMLLSEAIDFFIADAQRARAHPDLTVEPLRTVPAGFYVRAGHPLAGMAEVTPADLASYPLASTALGTDLADLMAMQTVTCEVSPALKQAILVSDAVMIGMSIAVEPELSAGGIVRLRGDVLPVREARVGLVRRSSRTLTAGARRVATTFDAVLAPYAG